ncbi:uncharacterized protein LOC136094971 [Hydra vulgaris]|uniref:uncharacterized protein LOC136094971 n=1 Tax=Hydra vulgaris TaxID=6087 RepID=UPI0032EA3648
MALLPTMPHKNFAVIVKSCKINGVKMIKRIENGASGREFVKCIAMAVREKCANILKEAQFFSILCDASQARKTNKEKELVMARIERCGSPFYMVLDLVDIDRFGGGEADSIVKGINNIFETGEFKLDSNDYTNKLVSITSDGASVNFGKYCGVIAQILIYIFL